MPQRRQPGKFSFPRLLCVRLGNFQPGVDDVHVFFWCGHATLALLPEAVKDKHRLPLFQLPLRPCRPKNSQAQPSFAPRRKQCIRSERHCRDWPATAPANAIAAVPLLQIHHVDRALRVAENNVLVEIGTAAAASDSASQRHHHSAERLSWRSCTAVEPSGGGVRQGCSETLKGMAAGAGAIADPSAPTPRAACP